MKLKFFTPILLIGLLTLNGCGGGGGGSSTSGATGSSASSASVTMNEDNATDITLQGSGTVYTIVTPPSHGILVGTPPTLTYVPYGDYNGTDSFTFTVDGSTPGTISIQVDDANGTVADVKPVAIGYSVTLDEDTNASTYLVGTDANDDTNLTFSISSPPTHGTFSGTIPNLTYMPFPDYNGSDSFSYIANDGGLNSDPAIINIIVNAVNDVPVADEQNITTIEDTAKVITLTGSDADTADTLSFAMLTNTTNGTLSGTAPSITYTPNLNYNGQDSFTYKANDGTVDSATVTVSIIVTPVNDVPVAFAQNVSVEKNIEKNITLSGTDVDVNNSLTYVHTNVSNGTLTGTDENLTYTPDVNYTGLDSFTFYVNDGSVNSNLVTVDINVTEVSSDSDNDFIPNDIEVLLGLNPNDADENNNTIADGLETTGMSGDEFFKYQWHLVSTGIVTNDSNVPTISGNDLNVTSIYHQYMGYNQGANIIVQVVDTGVDADHPDLSPNMDLTRSLDGENIGDPSSENNGSHGTEVAGIMAARAFNTIGVRGIIPFAKIAGSNWLESQSISGLDKAWFSGSGANEIVVSNNSWGSYFSFDTLFENIMAQGTTTLRNGKGRIYVFAAGNSRGSFGNANANLEYMLSNRYAIAVAALKNTNTFAAYSTPGSNILISGYSGNFHHDSPTISTTYIAGQSVNSGDINTKITWTEDTSKNYTFGMNGTSAASPTVAASLALVLEACPDLTWRDVRYLTAKHGRQIDNGNATWVTNTAGLKHSIDYGYGLINPTGMISDCTSSYVNLPNEQSTFVNTTPNSPIPDNNTVQSFNMTIATDLKVEWVEVTIDNDSTYASDYQIELTSPSGTTTTLMHEGTSNNMDPNLGPLGINVSNWMNGGFRLSTAAMTDEQSIGTWSLKIKDVLNGDSGTLKTLSLKIYGH
jgi:subtilisin-like proprotein convertase family protein